MYLRHHDIVLLKSDIHPRSASIVSIGITLVEVLVAIGKLGRNASFGHYNLRQSFGPFAFGSQTIENVFLFFEVITNAIHNKHSRRNDSFELSTSNSATQLNDLLELVSRLDENHTRLALIGSDVMCVQSSEKCFGSNDQQTMTSAWFLEKF